MGVFCSPFRGPVPLLDLVLGRAFLALCLFLVFSLVPLLLWLLCVVFFCWCFCLRFCGCLLFGLCVRPLVLWGFLVCSFCCAVGGSPPPLPVVSLPPSVVPLRRPGPVTVLVPPSGGLVASCDGPVALPSCLGCCGALFPRFILLQAKAFGPVWGFVLPSTPWCMCCCCALYSCAEVFIFGMIQDSHWTPLSYTLATLCSMCGILCSCPLLPSRRPLSLLLVWLCVCVRWGWCFSFPLCNFLYLYLGERSLELSSLRGCFLVRLLR